MDIVLLRFDAPLMSFGGVMVDQHGPTERFPGLSLLAGLFGNALGYSHGDAESLEALQSRLEYAARWDVPPDPLLDYHTVNLGPAKDVEPERWYKMREPGWTTRGTPEHRGSDAEIWPRYRHYWANGVMTLAVTLLDSDAPIVADLAEALTHPARPLFIGRKTCLPAAPLLIGRTSANDVREALCRAPLVARPPSRNARAGWRGKVEPSAQESTVREACWPARLGEKPMSRSVAIYDRRDWRNQIHTGRRLRVEGLLEVLP
ncbi:MAG: type I-E CRISPR-associated protein Cas5/CasD [Methylococcus sp.]